MNAAGRGAGGDLPTVLVEQIDHHVLGPLRARLEGLTDEEYCWDPTGDGDVWTAHPRRPADPARPGRTRSRPDPGRR